MRDLAGGEIFRAGTIFAVLGVMKNTKQADRQRLPGLRRERRRLRTMRTKLGPGPGADVVTRLLMPVLQEIERIEEGRIS